MRGSTTAGREWIYAGVPGHAGEAGKPADMTILSGADMPPAFATALRSVLTPGATILSPKRRGVRRHGQENDGPRQH